MHLLGLAGPIRAFCFIICWKRLGSLSVCSTLLSLQGVCKSGATSYSFKSSKIEIQKFTMELFLLCLNKNFTKKKEKKNWLLWWQWNMLIYTFFLKKLLFINFPQKSTITVFCISSFFLWPFQILKLKL